MAQSLKDRSIADFGEQWTRYRDNEGFYGSAEMFADMFAPLLTPEEVEGRRVAEIGSGAGRIVNMLMGAGAAHVLAVEPSLACETLRENARRYGHRVTVLQASGEHLPPSGDLDFVFSVGVLHHIPEPGPVVRAAYQALRPGGRIAIWLYGKEGNRLYLAVAQPLRAVTRRLPHGLLAGLVWLIDLPLVCYIALCRLLPLPLRGYMRQIMARLDGPKRRLTVYDQLNPAYARYYTRAEAEALLTGAGFGDVRLHHRHGYSWSLVGTRP
jgi:SAM-dependent methyltransferase